MDKYTKLKKIGEGSFGKAILVKSNDNGEQFVIKEIGISRMQPKERNEARKEVIVLSKMRHPNIVQYIESFEENGFLYIVMEYCEGGDLYAMINKQRGASFRESQVLDWFVQLCLALKHVHDRKILHRDIKTSNIFLTKSGSVKLGDFGIARVLSNTMELAKTCIGTPYYLSPEICENKPYNNKSDVWALGCVVYEILTLKHAFEAGNMKNLVLKIIRGSYPPVPSRYSYELRLLVSQLFRRNPRERPSVNSILKKPFISPLTERFLSPEQHEDEFSHTVLHKGRRPAPRPSSAVSGAGRYQPVAAKRLRNLEVKGVGARNAREQRLAGIYGPSVGLRKKPAPARAKVAHAQRAVGDVLEQRRQLVEAEQKRKDKLAAEKKKRLDDLQKRQQERALRLKEEQLKRARDEARMFNLKRSSDLLGQNEDSGSGKDDAKPAAAAAARDRPISAPSKPGENYDKYHQYLDRLEKGDRLGAAQFAAPGLDKVRAAWEDRNREQNAIMNAQVNRGVGDNAANRAHVVNEYLQRKKEAMWNKQKGNNELFGVNIPKAGVAAALQPYVAKPKDAQEREYLDRLQKIRVQNYHDRRAVEDKMRVGKQYKVVDADQSEAGSQEQRKQKIAALQQQAADRARILQMNMQERRRMMAARSSAENKKKFENMARARGIVPPYERPVNYNPSPIGITQALQAVGATLPEKEAEPEPCKEVEDPKEAGNDAVAIPPDAAIGITQALRAVGAPIMQGVPKIPPESASPSRAGDSHLRKKILQRVNQRYSTEFGEGNDAIAPDSPRKENSQEATEAKPEKTLPWPLPKVPGDAHKPDHAWKAWAPAGDIGLKIAQLPLEETASQMDATTVVSKKAAAPSKPPPPPKKQWAVPSSTFVRRLNEMPAQLPTMTMTTQDNDARLEAGGDAKVAASGKGDTDKAGSDAAAPEAVTASPEGEGGGRDHVGSKPDHKTVVLSRKSPDLPRPKVAGPGLKSNVLLAPSFQGAKMGTYVIRKSTDASEEKPKDLPVDAQSAPSVEGPQKSSPSPKTDAPVKRRAFSEVSDDEIEEIALLEGLLAEQEDAAAAKGSGDRAAWGDEPLTPIEPHTPTKKDDSAKSEASHVIGPATPPKVLTPKPSLCESPLFIKRNKHPDKMMATSPVKTPDHGKEAKSDPLSKSLYQTASDRVLMKITLGQFDSPSPKLLRTCSLPDLTAPIGDAPPDVQLSCDSPTDDLPRASVASSMNDTNFDEDEEVPNLDSDVSCHDDGSDIDDEERDMRAQLQMALRTSEAARESSSSPGSARYSASHDLIVSSDASDDDVSAGEDWESRSSSSSFEEKLSGDEAEGEEKKEQESIFCQLERNREQLEKELGFDAFLRAYKCVQAIHEDEDEEVAECQSRVKDVLGERFEELYPRILRLVMADGAYCEDND